MPIISVRDNEKSRWKRNPKKTTTKTNKDWKEQGEAEAIVKGLGQNYFVVHLTLVFNF